MRSCLLAIGMLTLATHPASSQSWLNETPAIAFWEVGDTTSERVIIIVHGGPAVTHDYLRPEWERLSQHGRVVFYDQRGCGRSGTSDMYGWREHVSDLRRLIATVSPNNRVVLAGSSWGALLVSYYVAEHSEDVLALILSGIGSRPPLRRTTNLLPPLEGSDRFEFLRVPEPPTFRPLLRPAPINNERAEVERRRMMEVLAPRFVADCPEVRAATWLGLEGAPSLWPLEQHGLPMLLFPDNRYGVDFAVAASAPEINGKARTIIGGGHDPWYEYPDVFFSAVVEFLADKWDR